MIRKWLLASLASGVLAAGMIGCGEEPAAPPKPPKTTTGEKVTTEKPAAPTTETKTE